MKFSVTCALETGEKTPVVLRGDYKSCIETASEIGYDAVEIHTSDANTILLEGVEEELKRLHVGLSSIGTGPAYGKYGLSLSSENEDIRNRAVANIKDHIAVAKNFGAIVILGLIKGKKSECSSEEKYYELLDKSMRECISAAEKDNVLLVFEIINRYESDALNTIEEGLDYIKRFESENIKLHIDSFHMNIEETDIPAAIIKAGKNLGHVHIADSDRWYAGHGHFDFKSMLEALEEIGYQGVLSLESFKYPDPLEAAAKNLEHLNGMLCN
ncbi:sugar phosphate isomerase/epimerase [Clostridium sp. chh4-2]|uniref:sugar phosphate isomerase/epimerase family protein n=1 Tax=Clostridium sp. chh4-2 TaxID=2067550 RepID=UPI000CCE871F|nr:sugar phosphate isomerase/epimerase family protein [Clostridium sp. chh4-2]PNV62317.1 sugar phosphate isomerase/epimerase [Clostridium sp. chh4-2]